MPAASRSERLLANSEAALISAIEIYNKPSFAYREETFAILALNAWELLLKAKLLEINQNKVPCLYAYHSKAKRSGGQSMRRYVKRNRSGNALTIGIGECIARLEKAATLVPPPVKSNLDALTEIRDNAIHYVNASPRLAKQVLEIGTACLRNFIELGKQWLNLDLSQYNLYLMPIGFLPSSDVAAGVVLSNHEQNLVNYLAGLARGAYGKDVNDYHVSLDVCISFKRTPAAAAEAVMVVNDPNDPDAVHVALSEEDIRKRYPWKYKTLTDKLKKRYIDFKENKKYHEIRQRLAKNPQYMKSRYLDPGNPKSARKDFFNPNIVAEFDKSYTLKS